MASIYLNVWDELGDVQLLEEVCHWGLALRFEKPMPFLVNFLCLMLVDRGCAFS